MAQITQEERDTFAPVFGEFMGALAAFGESNPEAHAKMMEDWGKDTAGDPEVKARGVEWKNQGFAAGQGACGGADLLNEAGWVAFMDK